MCPFRCGPYAALISNTRRQEAKKEEKNFSARRYWGWLKLQVFFLSWTIFFLLSRLVRSPMMFCKFGVREVFFHFSSHSHRANQQNGKKAFDLCSPCVCVPSLFLRFCCRFLFSFIAFFLLHYFYFHSSHCSLIHRSSFHLTPSFALSYTLRMHSNTWATSNALFLSLSDLLHGISEKYKFHSIFGLILIEKTNGSAKLCIFFIFVSLLGIHTGVK